MKRIVFLLGMICITLGISAQTINSRSRITLKTAGEANRNVRLLLSDDFSNGWDNTWDANPAQDGGIYVFYQNAKYSIWASNEYSENLPLGFVSTSNLEYTLSFDLFLGTSYEIYDRVADQTITVNGSTADYNFTIDAADVEKAINNRFVINYNAAAFHAVTTNAYGFCSFASTEAVEFLGGLKAYKGLYEAGTNELTLVEVGTKVPANTGVILWNSNEAAETFYYNVGVDASAADVTGNDFVGVVAATDPAGISADIYCLHGNELQKYVGTDEIPAGKAYLPIAGGSAAPRRISMHFEQATAIDNVEAEAVKAEKFVENGQIFIRRGNEVFNLQGQIVK